LKLFGQSGRERERERERETLAISRGAFAPKNSHSSIFVLNFSPLLIQLEKKVKSGEILWDENIEENMLMHIEDQFELEFTNQTVCWCHPKSK
jgi:hypothetical protein